MFHKPTNDVLNELSEDDKRKIIEAENNKLDQIKDFIDNNKLYDKVSSRDFPVKNVSPTCSCGRVATIGMDVNGCTFLQYCCDGYLDTSV